MAGPKNFAFRGIQNCKIASLTADTTAALTYGSLLDVAIQNLSFDANIETYQLKHNDLIQEIDQQVQLYEVKGAMGRVTMDVLAVFLGASVVASGSGTAEKQVMSHEYNDLPVYFKLETQSTRTFATDGTAGDSHLLFPKCKVTALSYKIEDGFASIEFTAMAIRTVNNGKLMEIVCNETAAAIT
jgi:hypothetical protein